MPATLDDDEFDGGEDALEDREHPEPEDADWNLDPASDECPYCGGEIVEDSQHCPHCDRYLSAEDAPVRRKSPFYIAIVVLLVLLLAGLLYRGGLF